MSFPGFEYAFAATAWFFERVFNLDHIFAKEIEEAARKIPLRAFDITDRAGSRDFNDRAICQTKGMLRFRSRHVASEVRVAMRNPLIQRFPANPAFGTAPAPVYAQEYAVKLALTNQIQNTLTRYACHPFRLVRRNPVALLSNDRREVAMLATDQALPVLDDKPLEDPVQEIQIHYGAGYETDGDRNFQRCR